jgi:hypothetical protein
MSDTVAHRIAAERAETPVADTASPLMNRPAPSTDVSAHLGQRPGVLMHGLAADLGVGDADDERKDQKNV